MHSYKLNYKLLRKINIKCLISNLKGKIVSRQQYETTINKISDLLQRLHETRAKMQSILNKFDADLKSSRIDMSHNSSSKFSCDTVKDVLSIAKHKIDSYDTTGLLENLKQNNTFNLNNLHLESLESTARQLIHQAHNDILPVWVKYDDAFMCLQTRLTEANRSYQNDLENVDTLTDSSLFEEKLDEMHENRHLFEQFNSSSTFLIDKFAPNENTKHQLKLNRLCLQEQFDKLTVVSDRLKQKYEASVNEHRHYTSLIGDIAVMKEEASRLLKQFNTDSAQNRKSYIGKFEETERKLKDLLDKFKLLNLKDTERIGQIYQVTNPCVNILAKLRENRVSLVSSQQERHHLIQAKLNEIERFLDNYQAKRNEESTLQPVVQTGESTVSNRNLTKLIGCLKYMLANNITLNKYENQLDEFLIESSTDEVLLNKIKFLQIERIGKLKRQINLVACSPDGLFDQLTRLNMLSEQLNGLAGQNLDNNLKHIELVRALKDEFTKVRGEIEKSVCYLQEQNICFIDFRLVKTCCLDPIEDSFVKLLSDCESYGNKMSRYSALTMQLQLTLNDVEHKLANKQKFSFSSNLTDIINKNQLDVEPNNSEFENLEMRLDYFRGIKAYLGSSQLKADLELVQQLGAQLQQRAQSGHEAIRIRHLDLMCRVDMQIKELEQEFAKWKAIVNKSTKLLDIIRRTHEQLAKVSMTSKGSDRVNSTEIINNSCSFSSEAAHDMFNDASTNSLDNRIELKDNKTLNQLIDMLKFEVLSSLNEHEALKQEIVDLSYKSAVKSSAIKAIVENVLIEWEIVNDKTRMKMLKLERFKKHLNELDLKLNKAREQIFGWEVYLNEECFAHLDLVNFQMILAKKNELENLLELLKKKEPDMYGLFKSCLNANRHNGNRQNQMLIGNVKERWQTLRQLAKEKLFLIQNLWLLLCDLNDQIENFYLVLEKTDTFYRNTLLTANHNNNPMAVLKLIQELYLTIQDDFKLIKYLNESYVNFAKVANYFSFFELLNKLKEKFLAINTQWDSLHNEIAVKIKIVSLN